MERVNFHEHTIAIIIPYYNASKQIVRVVSKIPDYIDTVIIVDDKSPDVLPEQEIRNSINPNITCCFLKNEINLGVGGATKKGFIYALEQNFEIVIKIDADDQMDLSYIPDLLESLLSGKSEVAKGNRFRDLKALRNMPFARRFGNLTLSFLIKLATGYWNNFDPTNGFLAIKTSVLKDIDFSKLANRYYFETSLLAEFHLQNATLKDIPMPAIYGDEKSSMNVWKMPFVFLPKLIITLAKRIMKEYFLYDFNLGSIYILFGFPLFVFGIIFGAYNWIHFASRNILTPTGTIMITTLSIILGFQLILQAIQYDVINAPKAKR